MSKIYLKKTYDIDGNANYQFVKKYFWGLITRPICFNIVKLVCHKYDNYNTDYICNKYDNYQGFDIMK